MKCPRCDQKNNEKVKSSFTLPETKPEEPNVLFFAFLIGKLVFFCEIWKNFKYFRT